MRDAISLKTHLQGKEHKKLSKQVKEIQAQATATTNPQLEGRTYIFADWENGKEIGKTARRPKHKCHTCNRKMRDANSLKIHLQGKEHKRITKQVKEAQAPATNTKRKKVRFK